MHSFIILWENKDGIEKSVVAFSHWQEEDLTHFPPAAVNKRKDKKRKSRVCLHRAKSKMNLRNTHSIFEESIFTQVDINLVVTRIQE